LTVQEEKSVEAKQQKIGSKSSEAKATKKKILLAFLKQTVYLYLVA